MSGLVLICDDDPIQRHALGVFLTTEKIPFVAAANGDEALEICRTQYPTVALIDIMMPGMDGTELAHLVQQLPRKPKMILMSGYRESVYMATREHLEVFAVVDKPISLRILRAFLRTALNAPADMHAPQSQGSARTGGDVGQFKDNLVKKPPQSGG